MNQQRRKIRVAVLSVSSNAALVILKLVTGLLIGSVSVISEAIHSGIDFLAALIALFSVKTASLPADQDHPFGHGKIENISGTVEALLIFVAAIWIVLEAIDRLLHPGPMETVGWGVGVMMFSAVVNIFVSRSLLRVGRETDSIALQADAWHLRTDVYTSAGVMVSLALIWLAGWALPGVNLAWLDPVAAMAVALLIVKAAYDLTVRSGKDLLDVHLPEEEVDWIRRCIQAHQPVIHGFHDLRTRKAGHFRFVEFHLKVDPRMTVAESHGIARDLKHHIEGHFPETTVTIHVEPCDNCVEKCIAGCFLAELQRRGEHSGTQAEPEGKESSRP